MMKGRGYQAIEVQVSGEHTTNISRFKVNWENFNLLG
jgi:hypothetical protein